MFAFVFFFVLCALFKSPPQTLTEHFTFLPTADGPTFLAAWLTYGTRPVCCWSHLQGKWRVDFSQIILNISALQRPGEDETNRCETDDRFQAVLLFVLLQFSKIILMFTIINNTQYIIYSIQNFIWLLIQNQTVSHQHTYIFTTGNPDIRPAGRRRLLATGSMIKHLVSQLFLERVHGHSTVVAQMNWQKDGGFFTPRAKHRPWQTGHIIYYSMIYRSLMILGNEWKWCCWLHHGPVKLMQHSKTKHFIM